MKIKKVKMTKGKDKMKIKIKTNKDQMNKMNKVMKTKKTRIKMMINRISKNRSQSQLLRLLANNLLLKILWHR